MGVGDHGINDGISISHMNAVRLKRITFTVMSHACVLNVDFEGLFCAPLDHLYLTSLDLVLLLLLLLLLLRRSL